MYCVIWECKCKNVYRKYTKLMYDDDKPLCSLFLVSENKFFTVIFQIISLPNVNYPEREIPSLSLQKF